MEKQYKQNLSALKQQIADITLERDDLDKALQKIIKGLEKRGISLKEVQAMIKEEDDDQPTMPEVLPTIEKPLERPAETPVSISDNTVANDVQAKIDEILAKFQIPEDYSMVMDFLKNLLTKCLVTRTIKGLYKNMLFLMEVDTYTMKMIQGEKQIWGLPKDTTLTKTFQI